MHPPSVKLPEPSDSNPTVPVGVLAVPAEVSVTVAVHVVGRPTATGFGEQLTVVLGVKTRSEGQKRPPGQAKCRAQATWFHLRAT